MNLAFLGCCALALKDGSPQLVSGVKFERSVGLWEISLDGANLRASIKFNGWPAGIIDPAGGIIAAGGIANEDAFIAAIETDLGKPIEQWMASR
jgi:hypothetical protein